MLRNLSTVPHILPVLLHIPRNSKKWWKALLLTSIMSQTCQLRMPKILCISYKWNLINDQDNDGQYWSWVLYVFRQDIALENNITIIYLVLPDTDKDILMLINGVWHKYNESSDAFWDITLAFFRPVRMEGLVTKQNVLG